MIRLHHLEYSRSFRILWALEELEQNYELVNYQRLPNLAAPDSLKKIHPLGKAPIIEDDGQIIAESAVILDYLQAKFDAPQRFKPQSVAAQTQYNYWMHYAEGSLMPYLVFTLVMQKLGEKPVPFLVRPLTGAIGKQVFMQFMRPRLKEAVSFIEQHLAKQDYFSGEFSFADVQMTFALLALLKIPMLPDMPNTRAFIARVQNRPAYKKAQQKSPDGGQVRG